MKQRGSLTPRAPCSAPTPTTVRNNLHPPDEHGEMKCEASRGMVPRLGYTAGYYLPCMDKPYSRAYMRGFHARFALQKLAPTYDNSTASAATAARAAGHNRATLIRKPFCKLGFGTCKTNALRTRAGSVIYGRRSDSSRCGEATQTCTRVASSCE